MVTLLQGLPLVCSGSAVHGIARKKDSLAWDYFTVDEDLNFVVCQACNKKESAQRVHELYYGPIIRIWCSILRTSTLSCTESFNKMVEVQNAATLSSSPVPFWQI